MGVSVVNGLVTIECNGGTCRIVERLPSVPIRDISSACSYEVQGHEFMDAYKRGGWDGYRRLFHKTYRTFPIGLLDIVKGVLLFHDIEAIVKNSDINVTSVNLPVTGYKPWDYQEEAIQAALAARIGIIRMATGGGKTVVAGHLMSRIGMPVLFLVHTKDLLYQAIDVFSEMFGKEKVGQIGDGVVEIREVTVATLQTTSRIFGVDWKRYEFEDSDDWNDESTDIASNYKFIRGCLDHVGVVFMDECHRVAAPTAMEVMASLTNPMFRFGLSASPWRDDGADLAITGCLGPVVYSVTASYLADRGYLVSPLIRMLRVEPYGFPKGTTFNSVYSRYIVENESRNKMVVKAAKSMVKRGKPCLILIRHIKHGEILQKMLSEEMGVWVPFLSGQDVGFVRKEVLDDMRRGRLGVFIASTIADEGLDLKPLQGLILAGGGKSSVKALQRVGRTLRTFPGKDGAEIVDFVDMTKWLINHSAARAKLYATEPAWTITDV